MAYPGTGSATIVDLSEMSTHHFLIFCSLYVLKKFDRRCPQSTLHAYPGYSTKSPAPRKSHTDLGPRQHLTRSSATAKSTARPSYLVGALYDIYRETNNDNR